MDVVISARHFTMNDQIKQFVDETVNAAFADMRLKISGANVVIEQQRNVITTSITVAIKEFPVSATGEGYDNVYKAVTSAVDKASEQARRYLEKKQGRRVEGLNSVDGKQTENL